MLILRCKFSSLPDLLLKSRDRIIRAKSPKEYSTLNKTVTVLDQNRSFLCLDSKKSENFAGYR